MTTDYVNVILKYMTWYKDLEIKIETTEQWSLPYLRVYDLRMGTSYGIYNVDDIVLTFKAIGVTRCCYTNEV